AEQRGEGDRSVYLAPRGQEHGLVAQADERQQHHDGQHLPSGDRPDEGDDEGDEQPGVERDVERGAGVAAGDRVAPWPGRKADRARPQPVQERAERRDEPQVERTEPAAQAQHLEQHRPERELEEDRRVRPPGLDVERPVDAGGAHHEHPADGEVDPDLDDVGEDDDVRGAEPVQGEVPRHRHDPLLAGQVVPDLVVDHRQVRLQETHSDVPLGAAGSPDSLADAAHRTCRWAVTGATGGYKFVGRWRCCSWAVTGATGGYKFVGGRRCCSWAVTGATGGYKFDGCRYRGGYGSAP